MTTTQTRATPGLFTRRLCRWLVLVVLFCCFLLLPYFFLDILPLSLQSASISTTKKSTTFARDIIQESFRQSYQILVQKDYCAADTKFVTSCLLTAHQENNTFPRWFRSMSRDASTQTYQGIIIMEGYYHFLRTTNPNVQMCTMEKIGKKHWTSLFAQLNQPATTNATTIDDSTMDPFATQPSTITKNTQKIVFFRDPLERFLSAYLDKCLDKLQQGHCTPKLLFGTKQRKYHGLFKDYNQQELFEAFVVTMPLLGWNLHFYPQSLYCNGIYRYLDDYDFVGNMGPTFYNELERLGRRYQGRFETSLRSIFRLNTTTNSNNNVGVETMAATQVVEYYSARSLRRVLEYTSIDYMLLNLPIPDWAEQILAKG